MNTITHDFLSDRDKMADFFRISKEEFLASYSYLTEEEYDATASLIEYAKSAALSAPKFDDSEVSLHLPIEEGRELVAELYNSGSEGIPTELTIYLRDDDNLVAQDIALVRYSSDGKMDVLVWGDSENEDFTEEFKIPIHIYKEDDLEIKVKEAIRLSERTPDGLIHDADTVLADIMDNDIFEENGIGPEILKVWLNSKDRKSVSALFFSLTGVSFADYVKRCVAVTTRG